MVVTIPPGNRSREHLENINSSEGMKLGCGTVVACLSSVPSPTFEMLAAVRVASRQRRFLCKCLRLPCSR
jgi:hypothetical protein